MDQYYSKFCTASGQTSVTASGPPNEDFLQLEDYDATVDAEFIKEELYPYLKDLYKDLLMRSNQ